MNTPSVIKLTCNVFFLLMLPLSVNALTPAQVFDKVKNTVVVVKSLDAQDNMKGQGSGVLISAGRVATNCHVIAGGSSYKVGRGKQLISAILYAKDKNKDICLLNAAGIEGEPVQLGKAADLKVGDPVYAVGAPQGLELSLSNGIVAQLRGGPPPVIQTTAAISPGSSGGGLFDGEGKLVGLTTLYLKRGQNLNFAMPVEWISEVKPIRLTMLPPPKGATERGRWVTYKGDPFEGLQKQPQAEPPPPYPGAKGRWVTFEGDPFQGEPEWLMRANALKEMKDWMKLLEWCQNWTKSEPNNSDAWWFLGVAYTNLKRYDEAIDAYRQALRINPEYAKAWFYLGHAYDSLKRYSDAIDAYRQALRINPEDAKAWSWLGFAYFDLKRSDDAIEASRQAIRINPKDADAWSWLGFVYFNLNRYDDAIDAYRHALRINPKDADAWWFLGFSYESSGNKTAALNAVRELRKLNPENADKLFEWIVPP